MHRIALAVSLLVGVFVTIPAFAAEPLVVDLWPGKAPGDVGIKGQETSRIHQSPLVGPTKLITNVTKPTLTIYQPAKNEYFNGRVITNIIRNWFDMDAGIASEIVRRDGGSHQQVLLRGLPRTVGDGDVGSRARRRHRVA